MSLVNVGTALTAAEENASTTVVSIELAERRNILISPPGFDASGLSLCGGRYRRDTVRKIQASLINREHSRRETLPEEGRGASLNFRLRGATIATSAAEHPAPDS